MYKNKNPKAKKYSKKVTTPISQLFSFYSMEKILLIVNALSVNFSLKILSQYKVFKNN
jgi:hypothetical protein